MSPRPPSPDALFLQRTKPTRRLVIRVSAFVESPRDGTIAPAPATRRLWSTRLKIKIKKRVGDMPFLDLEGKKRGGRGGWWHFLFFCGRGRGGRCVVCRVGGIRAECEIIPSPCVASPALNTHRRVSLAQPRRIRSRDSEQFLFLQQTNRVGATRSEGRVCWGIPSLYLEND